MSALMQGLISADHGERVYLAIDLGTPVGRAFPGNNSHGPIYGTFGVARFGIKCPDLWEEDRNGISFLQIRGLDFPEEAWLYYSRKSG